MFGLIGRGISFVCFGHFIREVPTTTTAAAAAATATTAATTGVTGSCHSVDGGVDDDDGGGGDSGGGGDEGRGVTCGRQNKWKEEQHSVSDSGGLALHRLFSTLSRFSPRVLFSRACSTLLFYDDGSREAVVVGWTDGWMEQRAGVGKGRKNVQEVTKARRHDANVSRDVYVTANYRVVCLSR